MMWQTSLCPYHLCPGSTLMKMYLQSIGPTHLGTVKTFLWVTVIWYVKNNLVYETAWDL